MNKRENHNQTNIEDLPVDEARQDEVKGGSYTTVSGRITAVPVDPTDPTGRTY
jgi:hypothetical protein